MIPDLAEYALMSMQRRSLRSWLTIIGIIIGVFSIVIMVSLAQGLDDYIRAQLNFFGPNMISVAAGSMETLGSLYGPTRPLTENDLLALERLPDIRMAGATMEGKATMEYGGENMSLYIVGVDANILEEMYQGQFQIDSGRLLREGERGSIVLGDTIANDLFDQDISVGRRVIIGNRSFNVVGVMGKSSGLTSMLDIVAYIPREDARLVIPEFRGNRDLTEIHMEMVEGAVPSEVESEVTDTLLRLRKVKADEKDFTVVTAEYVNRQVGNITAALSLFLGGIAALSLLVGSIGIANTMFMSVMERTREIGVMKAVGATNGMIMDIFMIESGIIGMVGGGLGLALALALSALVAHFGVPSNVTWEVALGALAFSFVVGVVAGYVPAKNAAKLDAVESLRFE